MINRIYNPEHVTNLISTELRIDIENLLKQDKAVSIRYISTKADGGYYILFDKAGSIYDIEIYLDGDIVFTDKQKRVYIYLKAHEIPTILFLIN